MFGFRSKSPTEAPTDDAPKVDGKGRPTPTRKEAEAARKMRMTPPKTRKEQAARSRAQTREARAKARTAMQNGDDKYLPERDKGPVKRFIRDYVDVRWTMGEMLLPVFFIVFVLAIATPQVAAFANIVWLAIIFLMIADSARLVHGVKAGIRERFGDVDTKGVTMYTVMRGWQMRRLRLPKPQVSRGDKI